MATKNSGCDTQDLEQCIDWLEKQGQKPILDFKAKDWYVSKVDGKIRNIYHSVDKVKPKFKVGDFVINGYGFIMKIVGIEDTCYKYIVIVGSDEERVLDCPFDKMEESCHLWTIQDAKDGDVLASELCDSIILFRGIKDDNIDFYCDYDFSKIDIPGDRFTINNGQHYGNVEDSKDFHPATKEQRDLLFQKMKDAGWEWNAEKKELKLLITNGGDFESENCEQKPANEDMIEALRTEYEKGRADAIAEMQKDWSEEDEERIKNIISVLDWDGVTGKKGNPYQKEVDWLYSLKNRVQPKQEWSEEDEKRLKSCLNILQAKGMMGVTDTINTKWLKSLKDRVQPKQEWSEEDIFKVQRICKYLDEAKKYYADITEVRECIDWLKSLKDRYTWKPTEEQMKALHDLNLTGGISYAGQGQELINLYNDLNKLKA